MVFRSCQHINVCSISFSVRKYWSNHTTHCHSCDQHANYCFLHNSFPPFGIYLFLISGFPRIISAFNYVFKATFQITNCLMYLRDSFRLSRTLSSEPSKDLSSISIQVYPSNPMSVNADTYLPQSTSPSPGSFGFIY